jgi:hypothetical protein
MIPEDTRNTCIRSDQDIDQMFYIFAVTPSFSFDDTMT